jgi:hypothetical protein
MLQKHHDAYLERKKLLKKKKENKDIRESREWYCRLDQWISDFNSLTTKDNTNPNKQATSTTTTASSSSSASKQSSSSGSQSNVEFVLPADENFTRCPISREAFSTIWDDEEGEMMFRNAVKVLVTENSDPNLYKIAKPLLNNSTKEDEANNNNNDQLSLKNRIRYLVVHKLLVMDRWLAEGKAANLKNALLRYESLGERGQETISALKSVVDEEEEDDEDIFVVLEMNWQ